MGRKKPPKSPKSPRMRPYPQTPVRRRPTSPSTTPPAGSSEQEELIRSQPVRERRSRNYFQRTFERVSGVFRRNRGASTSADHLEVESAQDQRKKKKKSPTVLASLAALRACVTARKGSSSGASLESEQGTSTTRTDGVDDSSGRELIPKKSRAKSPQDVSTRVNWKSKLTEDIDERGRGDQTLDNVSISSGLNKEKDAQSIDSTEFFEGPKRAYLAAKRKKALVHTGSKKKKKSSKEPIVHSMKDFDKTFQSERELQKKSWRKRPIVYRSTMPSKPTRDKFEMNQIRITEDYKNRHVCGAFDYYMHLRSKQIKIETNEKGEKVVTEPKDPHLLKFAFCYEKMVKWEKTRYCERNRHGVKEKLRRIASDSEMLRRIASETWQKMYGLTLNIPRRRIHLGLLIYKASRGVRDPGKPWYVTQTNEPSNLLTRSNAFAHLPGNPDRDIVFSSTDGYSVPSFSYFYPYTTYTDTFGYSNTNPAGGADVLIKPLDDDVIEAARQLRDIRISSTTDSPRSQPPSDIPNTSMTDVLSQPSTSRRVSFEPVIPSTSHGPAFPSRSYNPGIPSTSVDSTVPNTSQNPAISSIRFDSPILSTSLDELPSSSYEFAIPTGSHISGIPSTSIEPTNPNTSQDPAISSIPFDSTIPSTSIDELPSTSYDPMIPSTSFDELPSTSGGIFHNPDEPVVSKPMDCHADSSSPSPTSLSSARTATSSKISELPTVQQNDLIKIDFSENDNCPFSTSI